METTQGSPGAGALRQISRGMLEIQRRTKRGQEGHEELRNILGQSTRALCSWDLLTILTMIEDHKELIRVGFIY